MESFRVAVVVVTQRMCESLGRCLESFGAVVNDPADVCFVDNGSHERLDTWAGGEWPTMTIIRLPKNQLFCGGYNAGIRLALERGYDFVLIANADTEVVNRDFLRQLVEVADRWPQGAFFGPLVYFRQAGVIQKTCLQFPSVWRNMALWLPWRLVRSYIEGQPRDERAVEFLNGVCVLCRAKAMKEIGLMDESFGGYVEDADWSWRALQRGWISVFSPIPSIIHHEAPSGYEHYSLKTFLLKRNTVLWYVKHGRPRSARIYAIASTALAMVRGLAAGSAEEREKHWYFVRRIRRAFSGVLAGEPLGEWFGPPLGGWGDGVGPTEWGVAKSAGRSQK